MYIIRFKSQDKSIGMLYGTESEKGRMQNGICLNVKNNTADHAHCLSSKVKRKCNAKCGINVRLE